MSYDHDGEKLQLEGVLRLHNLRWLDRTITCVLDANQRELFTLVILI